MPDQESEVMKQIESSSAPGSSSAAEPADAAPDAEGGPVQNVQAGMGATADSGKIFDRTVSQQIDTAAGESLANYIGSGGIDSDPEASLRWPQDTGSAIGADPLLRPDTATGPGEGAAGETSLPAEGNQ